MMHVLVVFVLFNHTSTVPLWLLWILSRLCMFIRIPRAHLWFRGLHWFDKLVCFLYQIVTVHDPATITISVAQLVFESAVPDSSRSIYFTHFAHRNSTLGNRVTDFVVDRACDFV